MTAKTKEIEEEKLLTMRHSCAHVLAEAVQKLYPGTKIGYGPATDDGFFYDFDLPKPISSDNFGKIEKEMKKIIERNEPFERKVVEIKEAKKIFEGQDLKLEHIDELPKDEEISIYQHGKFADLCAGPHVETAKEIGAFKLTKTAGAYWKGDANNKQLTRIYGTAFFTQEELDEYFTRLEEAEKRDHRKLGKELGIYTMSEMAGVGLPMYLPNGAIIIRKMQEWLRNDLIDRGYQEVITPHIYNADV